MKIAIQGEQGSFSHLVALHWDSSPDQTIVSCKTFPEVIKSLKENYCDFAIIPIENSLTGRIGPTTNLLIEQDNLEVIAEEYLPVSHCLMSSNGNKNKDINSISKIYGHPEALTQCTKYLSNLDATLVSFYDGAAAIHHILEEQESALIASKHLANLADLQVLAEDIQDVAWNQTRFFVLRNKSSKPNKITSEIRYKTSIIFAANHTPGSLSKILNVFSSNDINLTRLESIPSRISKWQYIFLLDFEGNVQEKRVMVVLEMLVFLTQFLKVLGSYKSKSFLSAEGPKNNQEITINTQSNVRTINEYIRKQIYHSNNRIKSWITSWCYN